MRLKNSRWLVTGGTGFIGSALVKALVGKGARVRVFDSHARGSLENLDDVAGKVEVHTGDIRDAAAVARAAKGVEAVCHLAYVNGTRYFYSHPEVVLEVAVKGMVNVLDACLRHGVRELSLASSSEVYQTPPRVPTDEAAPLCVPDPLNPRYSYAGGKIISELMALNYGRKHFRRVTVFRPHNVYGPRMGWDHVIPEFIRRIHGLPRGPGGTARLPIQGTGRQTRAFIYIDDLVDGVLRVFEKGKHLGVYHVGTDAEVTVKSLAVRLGGLMGRGVRVVPGPAAPGATPRRCPDITRLRAFGFRPRVPLSEGLRRTVEWYTNVLNRSAQPSPKGPKTWRLQALS